MQGLALCGCHSFTAVNLGYMASTHVPKCGRIRKCEQMRGRAQRWQAARAMLSNESFERYSSSVRSLCNHRLQKRAHSGGLQSVSPSSANPRAALALRYPDD